MKLKRIFGMLLICCIGIVTILFSTIYEPIDENESTPTIEGTISYIPGFGDPIQQTFYYNDDYFMQSGEIDNNHLLSMSCNLALATFNYKNDKKIRHAEKVSFIICYYHCDMGRVSDTGS